MLLKHVVHTVGLALLIAVPVWSQQQLPTVAVLDFIGKGVSAEEASVLTDKLRGELVNAGRVQVIERGAMDEILREQGFQQSGCTSNECIVEVGQLIGVRFMVAGSIGKIEKTFLLSVRLINVATSKIEKNVQREITGSLTDVLKTAITEVAAELTLPEEAPAQGSQAAVKAKTPEKKQPRMKKEPAAVKKPVAENPRHRRLGVSFCKGLGTSEFNYASNSWHDNAMLGPGGAKVDFGFRLRYHYLGFEALFARSLTEALNESHHNFYRIVYGLNAVWYFERLSIGRYVILAPGLGLGYNMILDHGTYTGEPDKTVALYFLRFASPRLKLQIGAQRVFFTIDYSLLLGKGDSFDTVRWVHSDGTTYDEGSFKIGLASLLCGGIGFKF